MVIIYLFKGDADAAQELVTKYIEYNIFILWVILYNLERMNLVIHKTVWFQANLLVL
jgi:hypothetical protein